MRKRTLALLAISLLMFLVASIIRIITFNDMRAYTRDVEHTRELIVALQKLSSHLKSLQIYAGDSATETVYNFYKANEAEGKLVTEDLKRVDQLMVPIKGQQKEHWRVLRKTVVDHMPVLLRMNIEQIARSAESWRLGALLRINTTIRFMVAQEESELEAERRRLESAVTWTDAVSLALVLIALVIFGVTFSNNLQLTRQEKWLRVFLGSVLNTSRNGILSYKTEKDRGRFISFSLAYKNDAATQMLGLTGLAAGKVQEAFQAFVKEPELYAHLLQVVETGATREAELHYTQHGQDRYLQLLLARREDGVTISLHDISAIKQYQDDLKQSIKQLEQSNAELEQYAYAASHDLQEPLRKISTFGNMLVDNHGHQLDEKGKQYLGKIILSAGRMSALIKDILNFSSFQKKSQPEPVDLNGILDTVLQDLELNIQQQEATVESDPLPVIQAIPLQMHQLFFNLINNSLKFADPERRPHIQISCKAVAAADAAQYKLREEEAYIQLRFADNGIGFDPLHAEQIFGLFKRLNGKEQYSGSGIGLALCKRVVENHQGHIYAESVPGAGASFFVLLASGGLKNQKEAGQQKATSPYTKKSEI